MNSVFTILRGNSSHKHSVPLNTVPLIVILSRVSITTGESPIINCSPSLRIQYYVSRKHFDLATVPTFSSSVTYFSSSSLSSSSSPISGWKSLFRGLDLSRYWRKWRASRVWRRFHLNFRHYQLLASLGPGEGKLLEVDVSEITRLRKPEMAFVCVFRLISASWILRTILTHYLKLLPLLRFHCRRVDKGRRLPLSLF